jgi:hypothetical protein
MAHFTAEAYQHLELLKLSKAALSEKMGTGRPTKKDRRDIDEFGNEIKNRGKTKIEVVQNFYCFLNLL